MRGYGGAKRWWEDYLVRYLMTSIAGVAIVIWLGDIAGKPFQELLLLPKTTSEINTPTLILLLLYGNLFCYVASYPILSFHATRVLDFKESTWLRSCPDGYIATTVLSLAVLFISLCLPNGWRYCLAFLLAIIFSGIQLIRICKGLKPKVPVQGLRNDVSLAYDYACKLSKQRTLLEGTTPGVPPNDKRRNTEWRQDLVETYRQLREHGNSGFIFLLELTLAAGAIVSARTPSADRNPVVRIDAAIRSASGARVQHWSSLFHELVFPVPPRKFPVQPNKFPVPWRREFETETP